MASLTDVTSPHLTGDRYQLEVPAGWGQGRATFGGLVVGALVGAIEHHVADPARKVRSVTAELPGPVEPGAVDVAVDTLRRGNSVSTVRAQLSQRGEIRSHAVAVVAAARKGGAAEAAVWNDLVRPAAPPWTEVATLPATIRAGAPEFAQHFEYRIVDGIPWSGATRALGYVRSRDPGSRRGAAYIAAMIDAWWPVGFIRLAATRPMVTIAFTLDLCAGLDGLDPEAPLLYCATAPVATDGYVLETRQLWGEDGRLVAINHQTFVVVG